MTKKQLSTGTLHPVPAFHWLRHQLCHTVVDCIRDVCYWATFDSLWLFRTKHLVKGLAMFTFVWRGVIFYCRDKQNTMYNVKYQENGTVAMTTEKYSCTEKNILLSNSSD